MGDAVFVVRVEGLRSKANLAESRDEDMPTVIASVEPSLRQLRAPAARGRRGSNAGGPVSGERA
jgi:hypothetical protein